MIHPNSFLTQEEVEKIKNLYAQKRYTQRVLGKMFGISQSEVSRIVSGKRCVNKCSMVGMNV